MRSCWVVPKSNRACYNNKAGDREKVHVREEGCVNAEAKTGGVLTEPQGT